MFDASHFHRKLTRTVYWHRLIALFSIVLTMVVMFSWNDVGRWIKIGWMSLWTTEPFGGGGGGGF